MTAPSTAAARPITAPDHRLAVLFDADCGFCAATVRWLERRDRGGRLAFVPLQDAAASDLPWLQALARDHDLRAALHVVDATGRAREGGAAMLAVLGALPHWRVLAALGSLPPVRPVVDAAYRLVAGHRAGLGRRVGADGPACRLPPPGRDAA